MALFSNDTRRRNAHNYRCVTALLFFVNASWCRVPAIIRHGKQFLIQENTIKSYCATTVPPLHERLAYYYSKKLRLKNNAHEHGKKKCHVYVLLSQKTSGNWNITSSDGYRIRAMGCSRYKDFLKPLLQIGCNQETLMVCGKKVNCQSLEIIPRHMRLTFNGIEYEGSFIMRYDQHGWMLINKLPLENYLYSVLKSESWPGWPLEVNKAFSIASRSYVLAKIMARRAKNKPYDVKDYNIDQTYRGFHTTQALKQAVKETEGMVLTYKNRPVVAMFDCCCGSVIPAHIQGIDFNKAPYLARQARCTFCQSSKLYTWHFEMSLEELAGILRKQNISLQQLSNITISQKDKAGLVQEVVLHDAAQHSRNWQKLDAKKLYRWLQPIKSYCYSITKVGKQLHFNGKGYGHHLGKCQWGARAMVDKGFTYKQILYFYYPETTLMTMRIA